MNPWSVIRSVISALFIAAIIWQGVADYPGGQLWTVLTSQKTGYLWQYVILFVCWHFVISWTVYWQKKLEGVCPFCARKVAKEER